MNFLPCKYSSLLYIPGISPLRLPLTAMAISLLEQGKTPPLTLHSGNVEVTGDKGFEYEESNCEETLKEFPISPKCSNFGPLNKFL